MSIRYWLQSPNAKLFYNSSYDLAWLASAGLEVSGTIHDTAWPPAFQNGLAARGLKREGRYQYAVHLPKDFQLFPDLVLAYCANDAANTLSLYDPHSPWLTHPLYRLYSRMAPRLAQVSLHGLPVYSDRIEAEYAALQASQEHTLAQLADYGQINWNSPREVYQIIKAAIPPDDRFPDSHSTNDRVLRRCPHPAAALVRALRHAAIRLRTFLAPARGRRRLHGLLSLGGSRTGRTSARSQNLPNIPRDLRTPYGAEDRDWVKLDFAAAELVVAAALTGCRPLLSPNPHAETASPIFRVPPKDVTKAQRALGKILNFGLCYGGSVFVVLDNAEAAGIPLTFDDADRFRAQWFDAYPEIRAWQHDTQDRLGRGEAITSAFGRQWTLDGDRQGAWNEALAAPVSSTASDLLLLGADAVWTNLSACSEIVNLVHDELDVLIPKGAWLDLEPTFRSIAAQMAAIDPRFPMRVEVAMGPDWGSTVSQFTIGAAAS
jgi:DNA polymerase-1